jgi:PhnB protein
LHFYEQALGAKTTFMMTYGDSPMGAQTPEEAKGNVMHASFKIGETTLFAADAPPGQGTKPSGFCISIQTKDIGEAERSFAALSEGAKVQMPLGETFWAKRFGMLIDKFGQPWMVNCEA